MDEEYFQAAYENVKKVTIFSGRSLEDEMTKIHSVLNNSSADWKLQVDNLMMVRSLLVAGADQYDEIHGCLKTLEYPFEACVKVTQTWNINCNVAEYELMFSEPAVPSGAGVLHHHRLPLPDSPE